MVVAVMDRWRRLPLPVRDGLAALVLAALGVTGVLLDGGATVEADTIAPTMPWYAVVAVVLIVAPLAWRRTHPNRSAVAVVAALLVAPWLGYLTGGMPDTVAVPLALYSATAAARGRRWLGLTAVAGVAWLASASGLYGTERPALALGDVFAIAVIVVLAVGLGHVVRENRLAGAQRQAEAVALAVAQAERDERARIAREVHDLVAHHVSAMVIHGNAAAHLLERRPDDARRALEHLAATGRTAVDAMSRLVRVLRQDDPHDHAAAAGANGTSDPQPGIDDLDELAGAFATLGLQVEVHRAAELPPVAPDVGLSVYRLVQEALTNVVRHAGAGHAWVTVACGDTDPPERAGRSRITVTVDDDGSGDPARSHRRGHGLVGMAERAALHDGTVGFDVGPHGGWRVVATFGTGLAPQTVPRPAIGSAGGAR